MEICQNKMKTKVVFVLLKAATSHMMMTGRVKVRVRVSFQLFPGQIVELHSVSNAEPILTFL